jgi:hypothetical protein
MRLRTTLLTTAWLAMAALTINPNSSFAEPQSQSQKVSYESIQPDAKKALEVVIDKDHNSRDSRYQGFNFHLDSGVNVETNEVDYRLTATYTGQEPFNDSANLTFLPCGAVYMNDSWRSVCFPKPAKRTLPPKGRTSVQPGETISYEVTTKPRWSFKKMEKAVISPHVSIDFPGGEDFKPEAVVTEFFLK